MTTATAYNFSSGQLYMTRTDSGVTYPTPVKFGAVQDVDLEFSATNKELIGMYQFPLDVARGAIKVKGKAKSAQIFSNYFDLFFGLGVTPATGLLVAANEAHTLSTTSQQVTNHTTFSADLGVNYAATGIPLTRVAPAAEVAGSYSVNTTTVTYTFVAADEVALLFSYEYTGTTGYREMSITNQIMGAAPTFTVVLGTTYKGNTMNFHLNQAISEKLSVPVKNTDYTIMEMDFQAYVDSANSLGTFTFSQ